jgi:hypothetical protein
VTEGVSRVRHAVIAGTGRAGTTFLVEFLHACGLETGIADDATSPRTERARAGLERRLDNDPDSPYVVKHPWLFAYCDQLDMSRLQIDVLIVPMRDLMAAAESRVHQERLALLSDVHHRVLPGAQVAGRTPGGVLYSLDVVDQARLLAVGFHNLLRWAVRNELRLVLLDFPRLTTDCQYLLENLWPWLRDHCTREVARSAFASVARPDAVRVEEPTAAPAAGAVLAPGEPDRFVLERKALLERLEELETAEGKAVSAAAQAKQEAEAAAAANDGLKSELSYLRQQLAAVKASRSWRWTKPLRRLRGRD